MAHAPNDATSQIEPAPNLNKILTAWNLQMVMPIFTGAFIVGILFYGAGYAILIPKMVNQVQQQQMP